MTAIAGKTYYQKGLIFKAHPKAFAHQECCFPGRAARYNDDGTLREEAIRPLWAKFGVYGGEFTYTDPVTQSTEIGSEVWGGFFDLDNEAERESWDDREKEIVARHMLTLPAGRAMFSLYSIPKAEAPWRTYDETHHSKIVELAKTLGFVAEALNYEEQNKARPTVVEGLRAVLTETTDPVAEESLTASV